MQISLNKPEMERFVESQITAGHYATAEDVVIGALALLEAYELTDPAAVEFFRAHSHVAAGNTSVHPADLTPWDADDVEGEADRRFVREN